MNSTGEKEVKLILKNTAIQIEEYANTRKKKKVLFDKKPNNKELLEVIYENKDLLDLLVEKMKEEENERK
jgi:hypothetical protein